MKILFLSFLISLLTSCVTQEQISTNELSSVRNEVAILHFWATWCTSCKEELKEINDHIYDLFKEYPKVKFVLVSVDHDSVEAKLFLKENFPGLLRYSYFDPSITLPGYFNINVFPATVLSDKGKMVKVWGFEKEPVKQMIIEIYKSGYKKD